MFNFLYKITPTSFGLAQGFVKRRGGNIKLYLQIALMFLVCTNNYAQKNLVPNPSFEQYTNCTNDSTLNSFLKSKPDFWFKSVDSGAGYWNACANTTSPLMGVPYNANTSGHNFQYARTGQAYIGMFYYNGGNNYIQVKLTDSLRKHKLYYGEYYVNSEDSMRLGCNDISMLFTNDTAKSNGAYITANPQITNYGNPVMWDTVKWLKVSGIFKAQGGEQFLTLGNFSDILLTKYIEFFPAGNLDAAGYFAEDVAVYALDSFCLKADAGRDTTIKINDSVYIGSYTNGIDTIKWFNAAGQVIDSARPGFWVKPGATGSYMYVVEQTVNGCYSRDTVWVNVVLPLKIINYKLLIINEKQVLNSWTTANEINVSHYNIQRSINGKDFTTIGNVKAKNKSYNEYEFIDGIRYWELGISKLYYRIEAVDKDGTKTYSEIKSFIIQHSSFNIAVFPNPAKDVVNIVSKEPMKEIVIMDYLGREISRSFLTRKDEKNYQLSIINHPLPKGVYMLQVRLVSGAIVNEKLIID